MTSTLKSLGIEANVEFLGYQSQSQVRELLQQTDVFVMASFAEGVPVVLMEAMAAGVPVVATQIAGIPELVEHGVSGYLVPPGDAGAVAERAVALMADGELRGRMGKAGREKIAREFDIEIEAGKDVRIVKATPRGVERREHARRLPGRETSLQCRGLPSVRLLGFPLG